MFRFLSRLYLGRDQIVRRPASEYENLNPPRHLLNEIAEPNHSLRIALGELVVKHHGALQLFGQREPKDY